MDGQLRRAGRRLKSSALPIFVTLMVLGMAIAAAWCFVEPRQWGEILAVALGNIFGIVAGAWLVHSLTADQARRSAKTGTAKARLDEAFAFHREFYDVEMSRARSAADTFLQDAPEDKTLKDLYQSPLYEQGTRPVFFVIGFYQRLWLAMENHRIKQSLIPELFGCIFVWWYVVWFEKKVVEETDWEAGRYLKDFYDWLEGMTAGDDATRQSFVAWRQQALVDLREKRG